MIDGLKWDLRLYVLLAGTNPLRIYVYNEGMARFAVVKYQFPNRYEYKVKGPIFIINTNISQITQLIKITLITR